MKIDRFPFSIPSTDSTIPEYPRGAEPRNTAIDRGICTAIICSAYSTRLFIEHLKKVDGYDSFGPGKWVSDPDKHNGWVPPESYHRIISEIDTRFNGKKKSSHASRKTTAVSGGIALKCKTILKMYLKEFSTKYNKELDAAIIKTIYYSLIHSIYLSKSYDDKYLIDNIHIGNYLLEYWDSKFNVPDVESKLPKYYRSTEIGSSIIDGNDKIRVIVFESEGDAQDYGLIEYCERTVGEPIPGESEWDVMLAKIEHLVQILSTLQIFSGTCDFYSSFIIGYHADNPPQPCNVDSASDVLDGYLPIARRNVFLKQRIFPKKTGLCYTDKNYETEIQSSCRNMKSDVRALVKDQHEMLQTKKLLCTTYDELASHYVDITPNSGGPNIIDRIYDDLSKGNSVLITGSAGMGKSTTVYIIYEKFYKEYMEDGSKLLPLIVNPQIFTDDMLDRRNIINKIASSYKFNQIKDSDVELENVVLFIDAIDEYINPESNKIDVMMHCTKQFVKLISSRQEIGNIISGQFKVPPINFYNKINEEVFIKIIEKYSNEEAISKKYLDYIKFMRGLGMTPLIAAIAATHVKPNSKLLVSGVPAVSNVYNALVHDTISEKIKIIESICGEKIPSVAGSMSILLDYAWDRYHHPVDNFEFRMERLSKEISLNPCAMRRLIMEFTGPNEYEDRVFLHASVQDFLVAKWVTYKAYSGAVDKKLMEEFLSVTFNSSIQHFIGDLLITNTKTKEKYTTFCSSLMRETEKIEDSDLREIYQSKLIYLFARAVFIEDAGQTFTKNRYMEFANVFIKKDETCPQLAIIMTCLTMFGDMKYEDWYLKRSKVDFRMAEISRIQYMMYDLPPMIMGFRDYGGNIDDGVDRYFVDIYKNIEVDRRCRCIMRYNTWLIASFLDSGYHVSPEKLKAITEIDPDFVISKVFCPTFIDNLRSYGVNPDEYRKSLIDELENLIEKAEGSLKNILA